jgi:uncharacterized protein YndB with AHSA1/START domain
MEESVKMLNGTHFDVRPNEPFIDIVRDFDGTTEQLVAAHTDPDLFARWNSSEHLTATIEVWEPRSGGQWRYTARMGDRELAWRGCFHAVEADRIVRTHSFEGEPEALALEVLTFTDLGDGRTRLGIRSISESIESRDAFWALNPQAVIDASFRTLQFVVDEMGMTK